MRLPQTAKIQNYLPYPFRWRERLEVEACCQLYLTRIVRGANDPELRVEVNAVCAEFRDRIVEVGAVEEVEEFGTQDKRTTVGEEMHPLLYGEILADERGAGVRIAATCSHAGLARCSAVERGRSVEVRAGVGGAIGDGCGGELRQIGEVLAGFSGCMY